MHIRRCVGHIAQGRRAESAHVIGLSSMLCNSAIFRWICAFAIQIVEAVVVIGHLRDGASHGCQIVCEVRPRMTMIAFKLVREEERFSALCSVGNGISPTRWLIVAGW